ncbi:hypothetical protein [Burkholderia gladioli]|uniref:hypothetical protein n=1 Tax=Burkholderia gladioli TaxID=28095 RepID=UPI00163DED34|nr:hypothetical protein [Burkholderia gladioli]
MRNVAVVNRWVGLAGLSLCILLAVLSLPGWWYLRHHWVPDDAIVRSQVLRPGLQLYVVRREGGGAPVPVLYDYYLTGRLIDRGTLGALMDRRAPFLVADSDQAEITIDGEGMVCVALFGHVHGFANKVALDLGGTRRAIAIAIVASPLGVSRQALTRPNGQDVKEEGGEGASVCKMQP